jgi:hypothetical protein
MKDKTYLGDGLYAKDEGFQFELSARNVDGDHVVYLDDETLQQFFAFICESRRLKMVITKKKPDEE